MRMYPFPLDWCTIETYIYGPLSVNMHVLYGMHACTCTHVCMHMHTLMHTNNILTKSEAAIGEHLKHSSTTIRLQAANTHKNAK